MAHATADSHILSLLPDWVRELYTTNSKRERFVERGVTFRSLNEVALRSSTVKHVVPLAIAGGALGKYWSVAYVPETETWVRIWAGGSESEEINRALETFKPGDETCFEYETFETFEQTVEDSV